MNKISYKNIDLFFYHSIDIDFSRLFSILNHGIVSCKVASDEGIKHYYRNYTHSSTRNEYISVSHFPRTIYRYLQIENELYNANTNKICFIIDDIIPLQKQYNRNINYTNERHVYYKIETSQIKGILLREKDAQKRLSEIPFNYQFTDKKYLENKIFTIINFFIDTFGTFGETFKLYYLIGKLREAETLGLSEDIILELISREIQNNINIVLSKILKKDNPTLLEVVSYFNNGKYPIYIMNRFDIQLSGNKLKTTDPRLESRKTSSITVTKAKELKRIDKQILKLLKRMTTSGLDIYYGYSIGPLCKEDEKIVEEIKKLSLKKEN